MSVHKILGEWLDAWREAVRAGVFIKGALNEPLDKNADLKRVDVRPVLVKGEAMLGFTHHYQTRDVVKNFTLAESIELMATLMAEGFGAGRLCAVEGDTSIRKHAAGYAVKKLPPSLRQAPVLEHNRAKNRLVETAGKTWLQALGLTDKNGQVVKASQDKFKQINKYIEILDGLVNQLPERAPGHKGLRVVDMGSGKGYLTFALYDHLTTKLGLAAEVVGVEYRADMVELCNTIAGEAGFAGLKFVQGSIADYDCAGVDVVIALHACDTATDDALAKAIKANVALVVVAPCCHKQVRRAMEIKAGEHPLGFMLKYGTYTERMAEMVTDGLRAQLLELHGYSPNLFEFISDAHTPKNVMIVGVKAVRPANLDKIKAAFAAAKAQFGVGTHYLETLL